MDINKVLNEYDAMFGNNTLPEIETFLSEKLTEAMQEQDSSAVFTLLNEMIGFCRDTMQKEKGLAYASFLLRLIDSMELQGTVEYATTLLNVANAYRAFGKHEESLQLFQQTYEIYEKHIPPTHFSYASLFNNWSLLYQEMARFEDAKETLLLALEVVDQYPEANIQQAVTRTNLASTMLEIGDEKNRTEALVYVKEALDIFEKDGGRDFHYGAALVAMGDVYYKNGAFEQATAFYQRGLLDLEKHVGRNDNYIRVYEKYQSAIEQCEKRNCLTEENIQKDNSVEHCFEEENIQNDNFVKYNAKEKSAIGWKSNLERSREFYETFGKGMIQEQFPDYASRIAVGMVGEGSDCFGFDDYVSSDHDYAVGFCMWLTEDDYKQIGEALQSAYEDLLCQHGCVRQNDGLLKGRRGVCTINHFYHTILDVECNFEQMGHIGLKQNGFHDKVQMCEIEIQSIISHIEEYRLAEATNGSVFVDELGKFSGIRNQLFAYYPEIIWRKKLAKAMHDFSQYAQSNYPRMMARKDYVTANLCVSKAVESTMDIMYLLNKVYAPYYKWKKRGLEQLSVLKQIIPLLEEVMLQSNQAEAWKGIVYVSTKINEKDAVVVLFEKIAKLILEELVKQNIVKGTDSFLEMYVGEIMDKVV